VVPRPLRVTSLDEAGRINAARFHFHVVGSDPRWS
jgi:hypothetical protein